MKQPVRKQLKNFVLLCQNDEEYKRKLASLIAVSNTKEWKTAIELLWSIKNSMATELISSLKHTELTPEEKDIKQRVYHNINEWIDFLASPRKWVAKKGMIQTINSNLKGRQRVEPERKEQ